MRATLNSVEERAEYIMQCQREVDKACAEVQRLNQEQAEFRNMMAQYTLLVSMTYGQTIAHLMFCPLIEGKA